MKTLAKNLKSLRENFNYSKKFVSDKLGIRYQSYNRYETGEVLPSIDKLIVLADLYDVSIDFLVGRKEI